MSRTGRSRFMEAEDPSPIAAATSPQSSSFRRRICGQCDRPLQVCLCHVLPSSPIPTRTQILILRHPHESRHKFNTTPLISKALPNSTIVSARHLLRHHLPDQPLPAIYLFPHSSTSPAITLSQLRSLDLLKTPPLLIVFDATWKHAKEMVSASQGVLKDFAVRVCLDGTDEKAAGGNIFDSELVLRKEPFGGCVSTLEAVARCLGTIEPDKGKEIEEVLIGVMREMVRLQAGFLKPLKPRPKLLKKNKLKEMEKEEELED